MKSRQHMVKLGHRDAHEPAICAILKKHGVRPYRITGEDGVPDLLCRLGSVYFCIEIKADKAPLNKAQQAFRDDALYGNAPHYVVRNADEAAEAVRLELARRTRGAATQ